MKKLNYKIALFLWVCNKCGNGMGHLNKSVKKWKNNGHKCIFCGNGKMYKRDVDKKFINSTQ